MLGQTKFDDHQILNLYFLLMKKYEEAKFANDGKPNIIFLQINTLLEVYYDKVIKEKLHFIDKCKLEMLFKDVISTDLEHLLNIDEKDIEESSNDENLVSIIEDISRKSPDQENFLNYHESYKHLEDNSIIEIVNGKKDNEKQRKRPNQNYFPLDEFITKVKEGYPKSVENVNNIENFSKENPPNTDFENNNSIQAQNGERSPKHKQTKWKRPLPRFKYPFFPDNEKETSSENYYIFSTSTKLLPEIQLKNIIETLQNVFLNDKQDFSRKESEQIEIIPSDNFNHTSLINNDTDLNVPRQLTQSHQNFSQIRTIDNIISSNSNSKILSSTNSLNLQVPTAMNKYSDDIFLDFNSNIVKELENPLAIDTSQYQKNELAVENLAISMQNLNASTEVPLLGTNNQVCQNEIMNLNTEINLPNAFQTITTQSFYSIRTPNLKPPQTYKNWLDYFQNNSRPIYYESPEKNKRKRRKRKQNNDINENGNNNIWNEIESNRKQIDTYQELDKQTKDQNTLFQRLDSEKRFDNEIVEYSQLRFKTQFQNFKKIFLESSPLKFRKLTKFEKYFFYSIQPSQVFGVFNDCSEIAKAVVLNKTAENNSKIRRLSDSEILEVFNEIDIDISKIGLDVKTHLLNLKQKSQFVGSIFKNLDVYKIQN